MRFKRLLALLLAAALALAVLVGCGSGKSQSLSQMLLNLLDGQYQNVSVEIDSDLEAKLRQAISQSETDEELQAALEQLLGGGISFQRLGSGQQGDSAWTLIIYPGTDPNAAARSVYLDLDKVFASLPDDGVYSSGFAMAEMENGYAILVRATVDKAGTEDKPDPVTLESIQVTKEPDREYWVGEPFDPTGMVITATYSNGTTKTLKDIKQSGDQGVKWTPDGALTIVGTQNITISYGEKTTTVTVTVKEPEVDSLTVEPSSLTYTAGDYFNFGAGKITTVTAGYTYGSDKEIDIEDCDLTITPFNGGSSESVDEDYRFTTAGTYTLTVSYANKTDTVEITVNPATLKRIEVTKEPRKTEYKTGDTFDSTAMEVTAYYSNDSSKTVTGYTITDETGKTVDDSYTFATVGSYILTVTYTEGTITKTDTITITVVDKGYTESDNGYTVTSSKGLQNLFEENPDSDFAGKTITLDAGTEYTVDTTNGPLAETFKGELQGNGATVTITDGTQGLFNYIGNYFNHIGTVKDLTIQVNGTITTRSGGGAVAYSNYGNIQNCHVTGGTIRSSLSGYGTLGGVVGVNHGTIQGCSAAVDVENGGNTGGIAGNNDGGSIIACYSTGDVTGGSGDELTTNTGGVVGYNYNNGTVTACYHAGDVSVGSKTGGVVGKNYDNALGSGTVNNCYWSGSVKDEDGNETHAGIGDANKSNPDTTIEITEDTANTTWNALVDAMKVEGYTLKGSWTNPSFE